MRISQAFHHPASEPDPAELLKEPEDLMPEDEEHEERLEVDPLLCVGLVQYTTCSTTRVLSRLLTVSLMIIIIIPFSAQHTGCSLTIFFGSL